MLAVLSRPATTRQHDLTVVAVGPGECLSLGASCATLSRGSEEQIGLVLA